jgi:hypothetical protein
MSEARENAAAAIADLGLTIESKFIPFSFSQSRDDKDENGKTRYSLNWEITLKRGDREILRTDYSAGLAHVPGYQQPTWRDDDRCCICWGKRYTKTQINRLKCELACESGVVMQYFPGSMVGQFSGEIRPASPQKRIDPDVLDVIYSLISDSSVIDHRGFEDWASEFGYDSDSRSAEKIYQSCLQSALALRAAIGEEGLQKLSEAFQDF